MSHSIDLTDDDIAACVETGASVVHNPSAIMSIIGRCPVPELIDAGVNVAIASDGAAPDRGYDMFRHMSQCMHYHRRHFRDPDVLGAKPLLRLRRQAVLFLSCINIVPVLRHSIADAAPQDRFI